MVRGRKKQRKIDFIKSETTFLRRIVAFLCYIGVGIPFALPFVFAREEFISHHFYRSFQMLLVYLASILMIIDFVPVFSFAAATVGRDTTFSYLVGMPYLCGLTLFLIVWAGLIIHYSSLAVKLSLSGKAWPTEPGLKTVAYSVIAGVTGALLGLFAGVVIVLFG